jgi:hypothetical protein
MRTENICSKFGSSNALGNVSKISYIVIIETLATDDLNDSTSLTIYVIIS